MRLKISAGQLNESRSVLRMGLCSTLLLVGCVTFVIVPKANAAITYFGGATNPADNAALDDSATRSITPPGSMVAGQLVNVWVQDRDSGAGQDITVSNTGGQTWTSGTIIKQASMSIRRFCAIYNGTWSADPSWVTAEQFAAAITIHMSVYSPTSGYALSCTPDVAEASIQFTATTTPTITGQTPTASASVVTIALWGVAADANTWASLTGGWSYRGGNQIRSTTGSGLSLSIADLIQASASATGDVTNTQSASAAGVKGIVTYKETASASAPSIASTSVTSQTASQYTIGTTVTPNGASTTVYAVARDTSLSAATCTQIKAGNDSSGSAAIASANSGAGATGVIGFNLGGSLTRLKHSIDICPSNSAGDGAVTTLTKEQLDFATGYTGTTLTSVATTGWLDLISSPAVAASDVVEYSQTFSPDGETLTVAADGNFSCTPVSGPTCTAAEKTACYRIWDDSVGNWMTGTESALCASTRFALVINNPTPVFSPPTVAPIMRVNTAVSRDICAEATDDDVLTGTNSSGGTGTGTDTHPAGLSFGGTGNCTLSGTPTTAGTGTFDFTVTDTAGATAVQSNSWEVRPELETIPDCAGLTNSVCDSLYTSNYLNGGLTTSFVCSPTVAFGLVISQDPVATTEVEPDSAVTFVVSLGGCGGGGGFGWPGFRFRFGVRP